MVYDKKFFVKCLIGLVAMVALMKVTGGAGFAVMLPLLLWASFQNKPEILLFLLVMTISMLIGNSNLMPKGAVFGYAQRASMILLALVMVTQIAGRRNSLQTKPFLWLIPYLLWMVISSTVGWCPFISYLKLFLFSMIFFAYYGIANVVATSRRNDFAKLRSAFLALATFFIFGSMALLPFPGIAQLSNEIVQEILRSGGKLPSLFTGMTFHSQALGPVCAMLGVALFADLVFGIKRPDKLYVALLLCVPVLIWKTSSRTALGSFVIGLLFCLYLAFGTRLLSSVWRQKVVSTMMGFFVCAMVAVLVIPSARNRVAEFLLKYNTRDTKLSHVRTDDVLRTRQGKWEEGIFYFKQSPIVGNGFQVSQGMRHLKPSLNVLSAPVEKSIWVSAILEEGGVVGFILFSIFSVIVFFALKRRRAYIGLSLYVVMLLTNLGEFTIFSMSGVGGFSWALVFIGVMLDSKRIISEDLSMIPPSYSFGRPFPMENAYGV